MMTREEFDELLHRFAREWHGDIWAAMPGSKADDLRSPAIRAALLAAYDAQAARIAQLEREVHLVRERNAELAAQRLEADDRAYYEGRIAELEAALRAVLPWLLHEIEYPGDPVEKVANGVRALLSKEA